MFVQLRAVTKEFTSPAGVCRALQEVDLEVEAGELVAVIGCSGSGKTTLLNVLSGLDRPTAGEVEVDGRMLHSMAQSELTRWRGAHVGIVFQSYQLLPTLTVQENVVLAMDLVGTIEARQRERRALELLERVGLGDQRLKFPDTLSGGQQQRAAIARALANRPPLIVADEPTGNLDRGNSQAIADLFVSLQEVEGVTLLVATHDPRIAARAGRVLEIDDGRLCATAEAGAVKAS